MALAVGCGVMLILFLTATIAAATTSIYIDRMVGEINSIPDNPNPIPPIGPWWKSQLIKSEYRRLFPDRDLNRKLAVATRVAIVSWLLAAALLFNLHWLR